MRTTSSSCNGIVAVSRVAAAVTLAALLVGACSDSSGERDTAVAAVAANEPQADGGGWDMLAINANEVEGFDTLAEMGKIADFVLVAQATQVDGVRSVGPEGDAGIDLARVRFEVIRAIGEWDEDSILVEFTVPNPDAMKALEEQVAWFPPTLLAVREKADEEAGFYRLVNSRSLWTEQPGGGVLAPLAEDPSGREFATELMEIKSLDALGSHIEAARRDCEPECGLSQAAWNR